MGLRPTKYMKTRAHGGVGLLAYIRPAERESSGLPAPVRQRPTVRCDRKVVPASWQTPGWPTLVTTGPHAIDSVDSSCSGD